MVKVTVYRFFSTGISTLPFQHTWLLVLSIHHGRSVQFTFSISLRHIAVYFPPYFLLTKAIQTHLKHPAFRRNLQKMKKYDDVNCPLMLSSKCKSQCHVRNVYSNSCETQCCCSHDAIMVTIEVVRSTSTGG